jgi:hypothetical protein
MSFAHKTLKYNLIAGLKKRTGKVGVVKICKNFSSPLSIPKWSQFRMRAQYVRLLLRKFIWKGILK